MLSFLGNTHLTPYPLGNGQELGLPCWPWSGGGWSPLWWVLFPLQFPGVTRVSQWDGRQAAALAFTQKDFRLLILGIKLSEGLRFLQKVLADGGPACLLKTLSKLGSLPRHPPTPQPCDQANIPLIREGEKGGRAGLAGGRLPHAGAKERTIWHPSACLPHDGFFWLNPLPTRPLGARRWLPFRPVFLCTRASPEGAGRPASRPPSLLPRGRNGNGW